MKNGILKLSSSPFLFMLLGFSPSPEEIRIVTDLFYREIKLISETEPCRIISEYQGLIAFEEKNATSYYSQLSSQEIEKYQPICDEKLNAEKEKRKREYQEQLRLKELQKVGDWTKGYFVDEFGDSTNEGFISQTVKGHFSNSATEGSALRVRMLIRHGDIRISPRFRLYEYDGRNPIKGIFENNSMRCRVKDENGAILEMSLNQSQGADNFVIYDYWKTKPIEAFKYLIENEGTAAFYCVDNRYGSSRYVFKFDFAYFGNMVRLYTSERKQQKRRAPLSSDPAVRECQTFLNEAGYDAGPADGIEGFKTRLAVTAFQGDHNIIQSGLCKDLLQNLNPG